MTPTGTASKEAVCHAVFGVINGVQTERVPINRLLGIAATLILAARIKGVDVSELMNQASRVLNDAELFTPVNLRAAQDYVRNEL